MVLLPESESQWLSIIKGVCGTRTSKRQWQNNSAKDLLKRFPPPGRECQVHCECLLIEHLGMKDGGPWGNVPPFNYIGVSKLSCCACYLWIEAFNDLGGRTFFTKGSHEKWCWPWGMPEAGERVEKFMAAKLTNEYFSYLRSIHHHRTGSDSSDADSAGAQPHSSAAQKKAVESRKAARVKEAGGTRVGFAEAFASKYTK